VPADGNECSNPEKQCPFYHHCGSTINVGAWFASMESIKPDMDRKIDERCAYIANDLLKIKSDWEKELAAHIEISNKQLLKQEDNTSKMIAEIKARCLSLEMTEKKHNKERLQEIGNIKMQNQKIEDNMDVIKAFVEKVDRRWEKDDINQKELISVITAMRFYMWVFGASIVVFIGTIVKHFFYP